MINKILHSEKIFVLLLAFAAMIFNLFPYIYAAKVAPHDKVFVGSYPIIYDKPTYLAEMAQGEEGNWKMINMYTTEEQKPVFLYPLYLGMGHISRITHVSIENVFLIGRFFFGTILLITVLYFIRYFVPDTNQRKLAYFLALFATGVGWIFLDYQSIDLGYIPDAVPMVRFSYFPHFSVSHILFLSAIILFWRSLNAKNGPLYAFLAGFLSFILSFIIPFTSLMLYFLIIALVIASSLAHSGSLKNLTDLRFWKKTFSDAPIVKNLAIFFLISLPSLVFMYQIGTSDPIWKIVEEQNVLPTPPLIRVITGYGLLLILGIIGLKQMIKENRAKGYFFSIWITSVISLSYIPLWVYPMQRRFLETAMYVPLAIAASYGFKSIYDYYKNKNTKFPDIESACIFTMFIIPIMIGSNFQNWQLYHYFITKPDWQRYYLPSENIEAMKWIKNNTPKDSIILASFNNSNNIPYFSMRRVYIGHGPMTLQMNEKLEEMENFYSSKYEPHESYKFLKERKINYIFFSDSEKKSMDEIPFENPLNAENYPFLKKVYQNENASVYFVDFNQYDQ